MLKHVQLFFSPRKAARFSETFSAHSSVAPIDLRYDSYRVSSQKGGFVLLLLHLQVGGVDEGGVPAGEEGDGGRHLADVSDPVGDVELPPDWLPLLSPPSSGSLKCKIF